MKKLLLIQEITFLQLAIAREAGLVPPDFSGQPLPRVESLPDLKRSLAMKEMQLEFLMRKDVLTMPVREPMPQLEHAIAS